MMINSQSNHEGEGKGKANRQQAQLSAHTRCQRKLCASQGPWLDALFAELQCSNSKQQTANSKQGRYESLLLLCPTPPCGSQPQP